MNFCKKHNWETQLISPYKLGTVCTNCGILKKEYDMKDKILNKVHYAPSGEWGGEKVGCGKYFTTDVLHTPSIQRVACMNCLTNYMKKKKQND